MGIVKIGLCGSHRTGKTTLAEAVALKMGIPFVKTQTSEVFKQHGLDPSAPMDFGTRIRIQEHIIRAAEEIWESEPNSFITDRTPIDMMKNTWASWWAYKPSGALWAWVASAGFVRDTMATVNAAFLIKFANFIWHARTTKFMV